MEPTSRANRAVSRGQFGRSGPMRTHSDLPLTVRYDYRFYSASVRIGDSEAHMRINEVLQVKGDNVITISPDASVGELVTLLNSNNIGAVVVSAGDRSVDGIVSERDVVRSMGKGV